ncbi:MAG: DivIVA domain-containing protein [Firmicutes bacterium]|nr:DivIVA domain-containing protein [Bacillota bacterium]
MLTPNDIENTTFKKVALGYSVDEVDDFIDKVLADYEKVFRDNVKLNSKVSMLEESIKRYDNMEESIRASIQLAEKNAKETKKIAEEKADGILDRAEIQAEKLVAKTFEQKQQLENEIYSLKKSYELLKTKLRHILQAELDMLEESVVDFDEDEGERSYKYNNRQNAEYDGGDYDDDEEYDEDYEESEEYGEEDYEDADFEEAADDEEDGGGYVDGDYDDDEFEDDLEEDFDEDFGNGDFGSELGDTPLTVPSPETSRRAEQERKLKALSELFEES